MLFDLDVTHETPLADRRIGTGPLGLGFVAASTRLRWMKRQEIILEHGHDLPNPRSDVRANDT